MKSPTLSPIDYTGEVYRNIFTLLEQNIFDDVCEEKAFGIVDGYVQATSGIDHQKPQIHRAFQYGKIEDDEIFSVFQREHWREGRFGDGKEYGVWYGAEDQTTSVYEVCWGQLYRLAKDNIFQHGEIYTTDRKMYKARIGASRAADLAGEKEFLSHLVHPSDYTFCQDMGKKLIRENYQMLRTPSARRIGGVCTPLFAPEVIQGWRHEDYFTLHIHPNGMIGVNSVREEINFSLTGRDLANPYKLPQTLVQPSDSPTPK